MAKKPTKDKQKDEYGLTLQQRRFADELSLTGNKAASAIKAGIKPVSAGVTANRMLKNVNVQQYLASKMQQHSKILTEQHNLTAEELLRELADIVRFDPASMYDENGDLLPLNKMDEKTRRQIDSFDVREICDKKGALIGYSKKVKRFSKLTAIEMAGRNLGMWGEKDSGGLSILNINIVTDQNQLDNPPQPKVIEHDKTNTIF